MPSLITHHIFAEEVFAKLSSSIQKKIEPSKNIYTAFAQSHDYLFYYTFHKNFKKIKALGHHAHKNKTQEYLINIIKEMKKQKLENNSSCLAYLYGSITHYVLDTTCHPFIFYKTGACNNDDPNTYKYRGEHTHMEKDLDAIYYEKYFKKKLNTCNVSKDIIGDVTFNKEVSHLIDTVYEKTYQEKNIASCYLKGIKDAKKIHCLFINDSLGIKKQIAKLIEICSFHSIKYLSSFNTYNLNPNKDFLNLEHKKWNNPCYKEITSTKSFEDLYEDSIKNCLFIIKEINKVLYEGKSIESLLPCIPNLSYSNGLPLDKYKPMQYFEY